MPKPSKLAKETIAEFVEVARTSSDSYPEIAKAYNLSVSVVAYHCRKAGINRHTDGTAEKELDVDLKALNAKHEDLLRQAEEIARKIQEMTISFDHDRDGNVIVHGVGAQPLKAHYESWLRFLRQNGGAGLREYITARVHHQELRRI